MKNNSLAILFILININTNFILNSNNFIKDSRNLHQNLFNSPKSKNNRKLNELKLKDKSKTFKIYNINKRKLMSKRSIRRKIYKLSRFIEESKKFVKMSKKTIADYKKKYAGYINNELNNIKKYPSYKNYYMKKANKYKKTLISFINNYNESIKNNKISREIDQQILEIYKKYV